MRLDKFNFTITRSGNSYTKLLTLRLSEKLQYWFYLYQDDRVLQDAVALVSTSLHLEPRLVCLQVGRTEFGHRFTIPMSTCRSVRCSITKRMTTWLFVPPYLDAQNYLLTYRALLLWLQLKLLESCTTRCQLADWDTVVSNTASSEVIMQRLQQQYPSIVFLTREWSRQEGTLRTSKAKTGLEFIE